MSFYFNTTYEDQNTSPSIKKFYNLICETVKIDLKKNQDKYFFIKCVKTV